MKDLIKEILKQQNNHLLKYPKKYIDQKSQFFTPYEVTKSMINEFNVQYYDKDTINILEPSAGFGILIISLIEEIVKNVNIKNINIVVFEIDKNISSTLKSNLKTLKNILSVKYNINLNFIVHNTNFIVFYKDFWTKNKKENLFDIIVSNPPYKKINKNDYEALIMENITHGQPNIYQLFIAMSLKLLKKNGVFISLTPRNYLNGLYSKKLRQYIFTNYSLIAIHTFDNTKLFKEVEQEVLISTFKNNIKYNETIISHNGDKSFKTDINNIINKEDSFSLILPKTKSDLLFYKQFSKLGYKLSDLDIKISVGPIVQFRNKEFLFEERYNHLNAPLLVASNILENNIIDYDKKSNKKIKQNKSININAKGLIINHNYLLIRKIASKKDKTLLLSAVLEPKTFKHELIGLDNNLLYISKNNNSKLSKFEVYGLYCYINSNFFQRYYSLVNGTFTINVNDFKHLYFPNLNLITRLGKELLNLNVYDKESCDQILNKFICFNHNYN